MEYTDRLENYFNAKGIDNGGEKRANNILNGVGPSTHKLINTPALPLMPTKPEFDATVERSLQPQTFADSQTV